MQPNIWLHRQPIPKLRSTLKYLSNWSSQDLIALSNKLFKTIDLDNKQIQQLIKYLKTEPVYKPDICYYTEEVETLLTVNITLNPNKTTHKLSVQEIFNLFQDSKLSWEETYKTYKLKQKPVYQSSMLIPLPDNAVDSKKYWGLQVGDQLQSIDDDQLFIVTQVQPILDGPPKITYEKL